MSMRPTFFGLEIGKTGLYVSQKGLDVTGHNVSNVDTMGYTRQRIVNTAYDPYGAITQFRPVSQALVGSGAKVMILDQLRSQFLDRQFRTEQTQFSKWASRSQALTYIEALFENADGAATLSSALGKLFDGFNTVNKETSDQQQRTTLKSSALELCEQFKHMYDQLIDQQKDQDLAVKTVTDRINTLAERLTVLNKSIYSFEMTGQPANDLRDKRNLIIDELSALVDIEYSGDAVGSKFEVKIGGKVLVNHLDVNKLGVKKVDNVLGGPPEFEQVYKVYWEGDPAWDGVDETDPLAWEALDFSKSRGGELLAHINMRDEITDKNAGIPYFINQLNNLARALVQSINNQHRLGYTRPVGSDDSLTGINFFHQQAVQVPKQKQAVDLVTGDPLFEDIDLLDASGNQVLDADGNVIQITVPVLEVDGSGNPVYETDPITGDPVYEDKKVMRYDSNGQPVLDSSGQPIYDGVYLVDNITAGNLRLSDEVTADVFNIAASSQFVDMSTVGDGDRLQMFNNENMLKIFAIEIATNMKIAKDDGTEIAVGSLHGFIDALVIDVALTKNHSDSMTDTQNTLLLSADLQRTSISGVSIDEEMTNLIRYNHAYSGASRVITTMDEALDILINRMGRVGL